MEGFHLELTHKTLASRLLIVFAISCFFGLVVPIRAQQQQPPEDPEDEKQIGLWLDQGMSAGLSMNRSLEIEVHQRFDEGASSLFEYFVQAGVAFRLLLSKGLIGRDEAVRALLDEAVARAIFAETAARGEIEAETNRQSAEILKFMAQDL